MLKITSPSNPKIKHLVKLRNHAYRQETGSFLVEGLREIRCALDFYGKPEALYICPELLPAGTVESLNLKQYDYCSFEISPASFAKAAMRAGHDGVLATFIERNPANPATFLPATEPSLGLVIDGVEKPGNIGAMLRTADGLGVNWVILSGCKTDLYNPNLIRASLGAAFTLPILCTETPDESLAILNRAKISSYALALTKQAKNLYKTDFSQRSAIIVGREDHGLDEIWLRAVTETLIIPMHGKVDSLNVASSAAIALAFAARHRLR